MSPQEAERAIQRLNGKLALSKKLVVRWAHAQVRVSVRRPSFNSPAPSFLSSTAGKRTPLVFVASGTRAPQKPSPPGPPRPRKFINKSLNSDQVAVEIVLRAEQLVTIGSPLAVGEGISCIETNHALHTHTHTHTHTHRTGVKVNSGDSKRTWICSHCIEAASAIPE